MKATFIHLVFSGCILLLLLPFSSRGQENPFELVPRLEQLPVEDTLSEKITGTMEGTGNPFDLRRGPLPDGHEAMRPVPAEPAVERPVSRSPAQYRRIKLFVILGILILLSFLVTVLRLLVNKTLRAFINDNVMNQLYRDQEGRGLPPFLALYSLFLLNAGVFLFFLLHFYGIDFNLNYLPLLFSCIGVISALVLLKHAVLAFLSYTFPIEKEISRYNFNIIIFGIIIGLFLVPVNVFMAYASQDLLPFVVWIAAVIIAGLYFFRYLRSLLIANKFIRFHFFHFFLYFCTIELVPVLFLLKLILREL